MLIIDLINQGERFERPYIVLQRLEEQIQRKIEEFNGFRFAMMIYYLVTNWKQVRELTHCDEPFEYLEHRFNISEYSGRKYYRFAMILRDFRYLFKTIDHSKVRSVHMLDHFKRALENNTEETVMRALVTMTVREFERFSNHRPMYTEDFKPQTNADRPSSNRTSVYFDESRYQDVLKDAFANGKKILNIGTNSSEEWDQITSALRREGIELTEYEPDSIYASATITGIKPLLTG